MTHSSQGKGYKEYFWAIFLAISIALFIRSFIGEAYRIPTQVMRPNLIPGDFILASKHTYGLDFPGTRFRTWSGKMPKHGEIVIYRRPGEKINYIKRVVGLPGDTIGLKNGRLVWNGQEVPFKLNLEDASCGKELHPNADPYEICLAFPLIERADPQVIPEGHVFVIGDYRQAEASRMIWEIIPTENLKGKVQWIWLSIDIESEKKGLFPALRRDRMAVRVQPQLNEPEKKDAPDKNSDGVTEET
jgi:signal peptidase I